jgi:hypothetical protein
LVYNPHEVVKPQYLADSAVEALKLRSVASNLVTREGFERFTGIEGDTINMRVKGSLPVREYGWRNDRSKPIVTDTFKDTVVQLKIEQDRNYSAVKLIDEDKLFDFEGGWGDIFARQTDALTNYNEVKILNHVRSAPYERVIVVDSTSTAIKEQADLNRDNIFNAFVDAKADIKKMRSPGGDYVCLVGSAFASEVQKSQKLVTATGGGDDALSRATLGTIAGVTVVESEQLEPYEGFIFTKSGFVFYNAAPPIPNSAPFAASAAAGGFALRWIMDYDTAFATDRSLYDTFVGYNYTEDYIELQDARGQTFVSPERYFVRGVRLALKTDDYDPESDGHVDIKPGDGKDPSLPGNAADSWLALAFTGKLTTSTLGAGELFPGVLNVPGVMPTGNEPGDGSGEG